MRTLVLALVALAAGCGTKSPCAAYKATSCIDATIEGSAHLDRLHFVVVSGAVSKPGDSPVPAKAFDLPVELALALPVSFAGMQVSVTVEGLSGGTIMAQTTWSGSAPAVGKPSRLTLKLDSAHGGGDAGTTDGGLSPIAAPSNVPFADTAINHFSTQSFAVTNTSSAAASIGAPVVSGPYAISAPTTPDPAACGQMLTAGTTCNVHVAFAPSTLGDQPGAVTFPVDTSGSFTVAFTGKGVAPAYVDQSIGGSSTNLLAVNGTSAGNVYITGSGSDCVYRYDGTTFENVCNTIGFSVSSAVVTVDTSVWVGANVSSDTGIWTSTNQGTTWVEQFDVTSQVATMTQVNAFIALSPTHLYAGLATGQLYESTNGSTWSSNVSLGWPIHALAWNGTYLMVAGDDDHIAFFDAQNNSAGMSQPTELQGSTAVQGAWGVPGGLFYFTAQGMDGKWGVYSIDVESQKVLSVFETASADFLMGLTGVQRPDQKVDIYAVGMLGNALVHGFTGSDGTLKFQTETVQTTQVLNAVWAAPTGEVIAVGDSAAIAHLQ